MRWTDAVRMALLGALMMACQADPDAEADSGAGEPDMMRGIVTDMGADPDEGAGGGGGEGGEGGGAGGVGGEGGGVDPDMGGAADAGPMDAAPMPDAFQGTTIESCQDACDRFADCGKLAETFGDEAACISQCERVSRDGPPEQWFGCVAVETCNLLHLCRPPDIEPLACEEVCDLANECGYEVERDGCLEACANGEEPFQLCGEPLLASCDTDAFIECVARDVFSGCNVSCEAGVACNVVREEDCVPECVGRLIGNDPLAQLRGAQVNSCVRLASEQCDQVNECFNPPEPGQGANVSRQQLCAIYNQCEGVFTPCDDFYDQLAASGAQALTCALTRLRQGCPLRGEFEILQACAQGGDGGEIARFCGRLCEAQDVCEVLEGNRAECVNGCIAANEGDDPDEFERRAAQLRCGNAGTCDALNSCLELGSPAAQCEAHCARLDECGLAADDCVEACDAVWPRDRQAAFRRCVEEAADCDARAACSVAPGIPCDAYCVRGGDCGVFAGGERCVEQCDDDHFNSPIPTAVRVACTLAAPVCEPQGDELSVRACDQDPEAGGRECLNFCRATTECADEGGNEELAACISRCVAGLGDADGLVLAAAQECLADAEVEAECADLRACLPDAPPAVDCEALCGAVDACRIPDEACRADCEAAPDADVAGCVNDTLRVGRACGGVSACVGYEPPEASPDCVAICDQRFTCDREVDPYLCRLDCTPPPDALPIQLACVEQSVCPDVPICLDLGADIDEGCVEPCGPAVACGVFEDEARCGQICTGRLNSPRAREDYIEFLGTCLENAGAGGDACDVDAAAVCFDPRLCDLAPDVIVAPAGGGQIQVNTNNAPDNYNGGFDRGGPERVVVLTLARAAQVTFEIIQADYDTYIWLRGECDDPDSEIAFDDDGGQGLNSRISERLEPGTYFLFVDGFGQASGISTLQITVN